MQKRTFHSQSVVLCFALCLFLLLVQACTPSPPASQEKDRAEVVFLGGDGGPQADQKTEPPPTRRETSTEPHSDGGAEPSSEKWTEPPPEKRLVPEEPAVEPVPEKEPDVVIRDEPQPLGSWIGEPCRNNTDCGYKGGYCVADASGYPGGHCSLRCTSTCPDKAGKPVTFCVADNSGKGHCVSQCEKTACRGGYQCVLRSRFRDSNKLRKVCLPKSTSTGQSLRVLHIGDSQSSGSRFGKHMVAFFRTPKATCTGAKSTNNTVHSYAKVSSAARHWSEKSGSSKNWLCRATTVYTNGTASSNTNGATLCAGIASSSVSIFEKLIGLHKPNTFLIQLGGNSTGFSESYVKAKVKQMMDQLPSGSLCFWVAPSYSSSKYITKRRAMERWLKDALGAYKRVSCSLLTSIDEMSRQTSCTSFNSGDGLHMTSCGSQLWGELIAKKICALGKL